jgi:hypothetical protein
MVVLLKILAHSPARFVLFGVKGHAEQDNGDVVVSAALVGEVD